MQEQTTTSTPTVSDINDLVKASEEADSKVHAEQRTNILLYSGEHYSKRAQEFFSNVRETNAASREQKLRIAKNHTRRITNHYINSVTSSAPSAAASPNNENTLQDVKAAELNTSVIKGMRKQYDFAKKHVQQAQHFFICGEVADKVTWNPEKGRLLGYLAQMDETGQPVADEFGRPVPSNEPAFSGSLDIERIWPWMLIRDKHADTLDDSPFLGYKKLVNKKLLQSTYSGDEQKLKFINDASSDRMRIFDPGNGAYSDDKDQVLVREVYWRVCKEYPEGWYSISTRGGILEEGALPFGLFPIVAETCIDQPSSPRGRSPIKDLRPFQVEINRASSKQAEHQITLGDDKLVLPNGSSISQGASLPGIRTYKTSGAAPVVVPGRTGAQFVEYIDNQIQEMYSVAMVKELLEERSDGQIDPYALLYKSMRQKKAFSMYADKFERYILKFYELCLETTRAYISDDEMIPLIGKNELVNIPEFKNSKPLNWSIKLEPQSDDIETLMGKQLTFNHMLQYVGPNLSRNDIGKIVTQMPFMPEGKRIFGDLVIDEDNANNIILQMDRGVLPTLKPGINKEYTLSRLTSRQNKSDYEQLAPQIQQNYDLFIQQIQSAITAELQATKAMEAQFIPAQGFLTPCDFYVPDPASPGKTRRARLPIDSLGWLVQTLERQGNTLDQMEQLQASAQGRLANQALPTLQGSSAEEAIGQLSPGPQGGGIHDNGTSSVPGSNQQHPAAVNRQHTIPGA